MREEPAPSPPGPWLARCCGRSACTRPLPAATPAARHTGRRTPALRELGTRRRRRTRPLLRDGRGHPSSTGARRRCWAETELEGGSCCGTQSAAAHVPPASRPGPTGSRRKHRSGLCGSPRAAAQRTRRKASERRGAGHRMQGRLRGGRARPRKVAGCGRSEGRGFGAAAGSLCPSFDRYRHDATCRPPCSSHRQRPRLRVEVR